MNHPWPPNDPERADWDRRDAELRARIDDLENKLAVAEAKVVTYAEAVQTQLTRAETAETERDNLRTQLDLMR